MHATPSLFFGGLSTETSSFSNLPITRADFDAELRRGDDCFSDANGGPWPGVDALVGLARRFRLRLVGGLTASAPVGAPVQHRDYVELRDELLATLAQAAPVGAVVLALHGAMMSTECEDCEGDILARARALVGPEVPIGALLDPHAHLTTAMVEHATALVFMQEYPHVDGESRLRHLADVLTAALESGARPVAAVADCRMLGVFPTREAPVRGFVDRLLALQRAPGIVSLSLVHGFPWGDMPDAGAKVLVYATRGELAAQVAETLRRELWELRDHSVPDAMSIADAVARAAAQGPRPLVLADVADNPGGGAPSDSTFLLHALRDARIGGVAAGLIWDPQSVLACHRVGVGGRITLRVGGKTSRFSGPPLDLEASVVNVARDASMQVQAGVSFPMGDTAWIHADGLDVVLASRRVQLYAPAGFAHLGLDPSTRRVLVVKSTVHYEAFFNDIAGEIARVSTPGALDFDFRRLPYRRLQRAVYPRVADPFTPPVAAH